MTTRGREMEQEHESISWFSMLPEGCISSILSFTSPKDACKCVILSHAFKSAVESDTVWQRFLPPDCDEIIARSVSPLMNFTSKKQLYFHLCDHPILLDGGKLCFKLSKPTGKKCYMLCARELGIAWGNTPQYWNWISIPESRFAEVPELLAVCWLEIRGKIRAKILSLKTVYAAYLVFRFKQSNSGLDRASKALIRISHDDGARIGLSEVDAEARVVYLKAPSVQSRRRRVHGRVIVEPIPDGPYAQARTDGWMEMKLGEIFNDQEAEMSIVEMMFWESKCLNWKHGLIVEGIELRPADES